MIAIRFKTSLAACALAACFAMSHSSLAQECLKGDVNLDGNINMADVLQFRIVVMSGQYLCEADIGDGIVDFNDAAGIRQILLEQPDAAFTDTVTDGAGDFFWSTSNLNEGAVNGPLDLSLSPGESVSLYLYYSTNGPSNTEIARGYSVNVGTSQNGIIGFTEAETFNHPIVVPGTDVDLGDRWDFPVIEDGTAVGVVQAQSVESDLIVGLTAMSVLSGFGLTETTAEFDTGYDSNAQAFLCGRIEIEAIAPGTIELTAGPNDLGIANEQDLLQAAFARANISVAGYVLFGDVNLSGSVDFLDISPFIAVLIAGEYQVEADTDQNGVVDFHDIAGLIMFFPGF